MLTSEAGRFRDRYYSISFDDSTYSCTITIEIETDRKMSFGFNFKKLKSINGVIVLHINVDYISDINIGIKYIVGWAMASDILKMYLKEYHGEYHYIRT